MIKNIKNPLLNLFPGGEDTLMSYGKLSGETGLITVLM